MGEPLDDGRNFLQAACGTSQGVKAFKAEQRVEDIDDLIDPFGREPPRLLGDSPNQDSQALSSPFVSCLDHVLEVRVECGQGAEPACDEPVGVPETTEDGDVGVQGIEGVWLPESGSELLHASLSCKGIAQGFQKSNFRAELVVDGHAGDIGLTSNRIDGEAGEPIAFHKQLAGGIEDAGARLVGCRLALTEAVGAWTHIGPGTSENLLYSTH